MGNSNCSSRSMGSTPGNDDTSIISISSVPPSEKEFFFKILLLGDSGVGKSSILKRVAEGKFDYNNMSTVGVDFKTMKLVVDDKPVVMQIWDTAGQERYHSITTPYYRGAHAVILVFDITKRSSFDNVQRWLSDVSRNSHERIRVFLVGNKSDLESARRVTSADASQLAKQIGVPLFETSASMDMHVTELFTSVAKTLLGS